MLNISNELRSKLNAAKNIGEVTEIVRAAGQEITEEEVTHIWSEITRHREQDGKELPLDELEAVSGGADRDWLTDGCAATVEAGSWCGSNDSCAVWSVTYDHEPVRFKCDKCLTNYYIADENDYTRIYKCPKCGYTYEYFDYKGKG